MGKQTRKVKAVIFDWAGTMVDYGCFAPTAVFIEVFKRRGIDITVDEVRAPMGLSKIDHMRALCSMERIARVWAAGFRMRPGEEAVKELYQEFEFMLFKVLPDYAEPVPGALELVENLRRKGVKIGSTTGYTSKMMQVVAGEAKRRGYAPDSIVTTTDVPDGRPFPYMCYQVAINLQVFPLSHMVKVGDTVSDILEGLNAGMWAVGVVQGGSELGLTENEVSTMDRETLERKTADVVRRFKSAGAHYVVNTIAEVDAVIDAINDQLEKGKFPCCGSNN